MKNLMTNSLLLIARRQMLTLVFLIVSSSGAFAQTTAFNYQGRLTDTGGTATAYDLQFTLYDETGTAISGATQTIEDVSVTNGTFTVQLDFGAAAFPGAARTLEIAVRRGTETGAFTTLTPRVTLASSPYAIQSLNAATATNATNAVNAQTANTATTAGSVTGVVGITNGGTGSTAQNFVDLTTPQTVAGDKTFSNAVNTATQYNIGGVRALSFGGTTNLFVGDNNGAANTGTSNSFVGRSAGSVNTTGNNNSFFGREAGRANTTGFQNSFVGSGAGNNNMTSNFNSFFGAFAGSNNTTGWGVTRLSVQVQATVTQRASTIHLSARSRD